MVQDHTSLPILLNSKANGMKTVWVVQANSLIPSDNAGSDQSLKAFLLLLHLSWLEELVSCCLNNF